MDFETANRILAADPEFMALRGRFNALGIWRFITFVVAAIVAITAGINQSWGWLIGACIVSFIITMVLNYQRMLIQARQQNRARELGLIP